MFVIQFMAEDQFSGTKPTRNTMGDWKVVKPHDHEVKKVDVHHLGETWIWEGTDNATNAFFDLANTTFNFSHVLSSRGCVEGKHWKVIANLGGFVIHEYCVDCEAHPGIDANYALKKGSKFWGSPGGGMFNRN